MMALPPTLRTARPPSSPAAANEAGLGTPDLEECRELATALAHCVESGLWEKGHRIARLLFPAGQEFRHAISRFYWEMACFQDWGGAAAAARAAARLALAIDLRIEAEIGAHPRLQQILLYPSSN